METSEGKKKVGIVGGGEKSKNLLEIFQKSKGAEPIYVVDPDANAPAMTLAMRLGIKTLTKPEMAVKNFAADLILDASESSEMSDFLHNNRGTAQVISLSAAMLFITIIEENRNKANDQVFTDLSSVRQEIDRNTRDVSKTLHGIEKISNELEVLAINAGIQASRAGEFGKGFAVVAGEVKSTARVARDLAGDIDRVISEISSMSNRIEQSLKKVL
ncbi:MAG: methyl-accepting chemotaxis protein [Magnetococcus sp. THC-1_WYH]